MMRISAVRRLLLSEPYAPPGDAEHEVHLSSGYRSASLIQVTTDDGTYGLGERYAGGGNLKPRADLKSELEEDPDAGFRAVKILINRMSAPQIVETIDQLLSIEEPAEVTNYEGLCEIRRQSAPTIAGGKTTSSLVEVEA